MASIGALAIRRGQVEARLTTLTARLTGRGGAGPVPPASYSKDPQIAALERLEYLADLLTAVAGSTEAGAPAEPPRDRAPGAPAGAPAPGPVLPTPAPAADPAGRTGKGRG